MLFTDVDTSILHALYAIRSFKVTYAFIGISELGSIVTIIGFTLCIALILYIRHRYAEIMGLGIAVVGSAATMYILKHVVQRARPGQFYQAYTETGYSFPSGHATDAAALYGFAAYLILLLAPEKYRRLGAIFCGFIILAIGFSRLYLGVHYFSDVIAGFIVGGFFVWLGIRCISFVRKNLSSFLR